MTTRVRAPWVAAVLAGCAASPQGAPVTPDADVMIPPAPDAPIVERPDAYVPPPPKPLPDAGAFGSGPAGAACTKGADCAGGWCLGAPGQLAAGNPRFDGGYCTHVGCTIDSQDGCGPDEWCLDGGGDIGGFCVLMCSKADGLVCSRSDQVCLGIGTFGACFSRAAVECNVQKKNCPAGQLCSRIGFDDRSLGRCETICDPMNDMCSRADACYYIRSYNTPFCNVPGTSVNEQPCSCDKCCVPGSACTPDLDGVGRHCKTYCRVADGAGCAAGEKCVPLEEVSPFGGCVAPGSAGT
jgi:hypothetical protein